MKTKSKNISSVEIRAIGYCYLNEEGAVFLNRWDQHIKQFKTYNQAIEFAIDNIKLINVKINKL